MLQSLLDNLVIAGGHRNANLLAPDDHGDEQKADEKTYHGSCDEHVNHADLANPALEGERKNDADNVAEECDSNESLGDKLVGARELVCDYPGFEVVISENLHRGNCQ